ncbi:MAG: ABC transporter ATP-binding protein [Bacilli bacterium]|nr:ABC transporter ATP-binding protein [Bacilli bacterium]MDD4066271.1 ABC transporter ATP-binding protein [Bacilli bacterium]
MFKLLKNLRSKDVVALIVALGFIVIQVWLDLTIPDYMSEVTKLVQTEGSSMHEIIIAGVKMLACALGSLVAAVIVAILASKAGTSFSAHVRERVFNQVQSFSLEEMADFSTSSLITRTTNDITQIQNFVVMGFQVLVKAPIMAVWAIIKIVDKSWQWSIATGVAVGILAVIVIICICIAVPKYNQIQKLTDNLNRVTRENLTGIKVVRAYNAENYQEEKFEKCNKDVTDANTVANRALAFMTPAIQATMNGLTLAIYWIGAGLISAALIAERLNLFSNMVVFTSYAIQVVMAFMMLVMAFIMLPRAFVSAKRINEVLDTKISIKDGAGVTNDSGKGEIEFNDVSFAYPDAKDCIVKNISFTAKPGEIVAFIGATGCGKSTIINLIPRFFDISKSEIKIDGVNIQDYKLNELRNKIGYVSQKTVLFKGTIRSNVALGDNGHKEELNSHVEEAVKISQASEFVTKLEGGYDGYVAQTGSNLSGGQKQRVSIARAICRKPEIFIFDDSFSALDYKTDRQVRDNIKQQCQGVTTLIVAQRIGTIREADQIIVLENGQIVGKGKHQDLMKTCEVYQQIALSQLSKEELA